MAAKEIRLGESPIFVQAGLLDQVGEHAKKHAPAHRYAIVTDSRVERFYLERVRNSFADDTIVVAIVPAGERYKTRETWATVSDQLLAGGLRRDSAIIALGGGVVGDLAGFVASTLFRGVPVVQVPTTLVAMVDASIGGKTGVDTPGGKNLVGSFHMPAAVLIDPQAIASLPLRQFRAGFAEVIKCGAVADSVYFDLARNAAAELFSADGKPERSDKLEPLIVGGIGIKVRIVSMDERETGLRKILNFGHTIGHAIEVVSGYSLLHGEAVAIGMAVECEIAERIGAAERGTAVQISDALVAAGLPTKLPPQCDPDLMLEAMGRDKKVRAGKIRLAVPKKVGEMAKDGSDWSVPVADSLIKEVLEWQKKT